MLQGIAFVLLIAAGGAEPPSSPPARAPERPPPARILDEARRVVDGARTSRYSHATEIDPATGTYICDCSALVGHLLRKAAPGALRAIPLPRGRSRPRAVEFYEAFAAAPAGASGKGPWRRVPRLMDARPGDIIAWRRVVLEPGKDTGHTVVVERGPVEAGNGLVRLEVIDSTGIRHARDSRAKGASGVGRGTIWMRVDASGKPTGVHWQSPERGLREAPIAIGRCVPSAEAGEAGARRRGRV